MASTLYELRKSEGYRNADDFAKDMDLNASSYKRYEFAPEKTPLNIAWKLADRFNTTIDVVVGRAPYPQGNSLDRFYDSLSADNQKLLDDFLDFIATRQKVENKQRQQEEQHKYDQIARNFENKFLQELGNNLEGKDLIFLGSGEEIKRSFYEYVLREYTNLRNAQITQWAESELGAFFEDGGAITGLPQEGILPNDSHFETLVIEYFDEQAHNHFNKQEGAIDVVVSKIMSAYERAHPTPKSTKTRVEHYLMDITNLEDDDFNS